MRHRLESRRNEFTGLAGMTNISDGKSFLKVKDFILTREKTASKFNFFSRKDLVFKAGIYVNYSIDGAARISVKEGM